MIDKSYSFYTTCKNRTCHLKKTYIKNIDLMYQRLPNVEFILLDYSTNDDLHEWIESNDRLKFFISKGILKVFRIDNQQYFKMAHAKNIAAKQCSGEFICSLDADVIISPLILTKILMRLRTSVIINTIYINGFVFCRKSDYLAVTGYDETMNTWGFEDKDFVNRLLLNDKSLKTFMVDKKIISRIDHSKKMRIENMDTKDMTVEAFMSDSKITTANKLLENYSTNTIKVNEKFGEGDVKRLYTDLVIKTEKQIVTSLWVGDELSNMEKLCIQSFLKNGFGFRLFTYNHVEGIPEGVEVLDANTVIPENKIFKTENSLSGYSNIFKYTYLYRNGGIWVDMDVVCLKPFTIEDDFMFTSEQGKKKKSHKINLAVVKVPPKTQLMSLAMRLSNNLNNQSKTWGLTGPTIFDALIKELGFNDYCTEPERHCFLHWSNFKDMFKDIEIPDNAETVHLWNELFRRNGINKNDNFEQNSLIERLKNKYL